MSRSRRPFSTSFVTLSRSPPLPRRPFLSESAARASRTSMVASLRTRRSRLAARIESTVTSIHLEDGQERFLRKLDRAYRLHALLALFLLLEKLLLTRDVTAIA